MLRSVGFRIQLRIAVEAKQHFFIQGTAVIGPQQDLALYLPDTPVPETDSTFNPHFLCIDEDGLCRPFPMNNQEAIRLTLRQVFISLPSPSRTMTRAAGTGHLMRWVINRDGREELAFRTVTKACRETSFIGL
jgi:hypothetical protein